MSLQEALSEREDIPASEVSTDGVARGVRSTCFPTEAPENIHAFVLRWNGQWISGDRFARDYSAGVILFDAEVRQAVSRFHAARSGAGKQELEAHAVTWAAVIVAFEAAGFREADRRILLAALRDELHPYWHQEEASDTALDDAIVGRALLYRALQDRVSHLESAMRIVNSFLRTVGMCEPISSSALARHLSALLGYRLLRDIYRLSAASRLRAALVS